MSTVAPETTRVESLDWVVIPSIVLLVRRRFPIPVNPIPNSKQHVHVLCACIYSKGVDLAYCLFSKMGSA